MIEADKGKTTLTEGMKYAWESDYSLFVPRPKLEPELWQVEISLGG